MDAVVKSIIPDSPASKTIIAPGDVLRKINGNVIGDILDYKFHSYDARLLFEMTGAGGRLKLVRLSKPEGGDAGLVFETFLMDKQRSCANKCIFCFIDQLPDGMRETLYYKDDDVRLSFLQGNYVTLTNLTDLDVERIVRLRVSPVNVSVHTLDPDLRSFMLGTKKAAAGIKVLETFVRSGIAVNCQIVCCPGINDNGELTAAMEGLYALGSGVKSVSVVPVGLTRHRQGLMPLRSFDHELALRTVRQVELFAWKCLRERGSRLFFCSDELYISAGMRLPPLRFYEGFPQLENGVGMMRLFIAEFVKELGNIPVPNPVSDEPFSIATGVLAAKYLTKLLKFSTEKCGTIRGRVFAVRNEFFGESVTVSGLITGGDIIRQLKGRELGSRLLIPQNMLKRGENVFLDDATTADVSAALGVPVSAVRQDGADLLSAFLVKY